MYLAAFLFLYSYTPRVIFHLGVFRMLATNFRPLFSLLRNDYPENTVHGEVFIASSGVLLNGKEAEKNLGQSFCPRSVLKIWQTKYLLEKIRSKSEEAYERVASSSYLPLLFASHSGQKQHLEQWHYAAKELAIDSSELECPDSYPRDRLIAFDLKKQGVESSAEYHQCSGKHLLFVYACKVLGVDVKEYVDLDHPIHTGMHSLMQSWIDGPLKVLKDGCGLPNYVVSTQRFLDASFRLSLKGREPGSVEHTLFEAWKNSPRLVGGVRRLDSDITEETGGLFFAKEGADGLLWLQSLSNDPVTILIKLGFGYKERYLAYGIFSELLRLKKRNALDHPDLEHLYSYLGFLVRNKLEEHQQLGLCGLT